MSPVILSIVGLAVAAAKELPEYIVIVYETSCLDLEKDILSTDQRRILTSYKEDLFVELGLRTYKIDIDVLTDERLCRRKKWRSCIAGREHELPLIIVHRKDGKTTVIKMPKTKSETLEAINLAR